MMKTITLDKLIASPRNVRRSTDDEADRQLKADIEARGLLQNLVVSSVRKPRGCFAVEAGGRRLRALKALADEGMLPAGADVNCFVLDDGSAAKEASLAENFQRLSMNPADECTAFQQLIEQGADVEGIARRFGLTTRFVEGRLRLAGLAPAIFEALGAGDISLDLAKAYAANPDHERQLHVFEQMNRGFGGAHPDSVRRMMTQATVRASDRRARFVGEEAYVAAGGRVERDLFSEDDEARWLDIALLERLAADKMQEEASRVAAEFGLGFVRPTLDSWIGYEQTQGLRRLELPKPPLSDEENAEVDQLDAEIQALVDELGDEEMESADREAARSRILDLGDRIEAIVEKRPLIDEDMKPEVGAFLILDERGRPRLGLNYYVEAEPDEAGAEPQGEADCTASSSRKPTKARMSQRLVDELAMQRRDILGVHLAADGILALDLAIFLMVDRDAGLSFERKGSSLAASPPSDPVPGFKTPDAKASIARAEAAGALDRSWTDGATLAERFDAFRALAVEARRAWLCYAVARTLESSLNLDGAGRCAFHDHLGQVLAVDVAAWWRPTALNFFDRVPKAMVLEALAEVGGPELAATHAKSKKAELAEACERIFAGNFIAGAETKVAALSWVPDVMRFASPQALPASADDEAEAEAEAVDADSGADAGADADDNGGADAGSEAGCSGEPDVPFDMPEDEERLAGDQVGKAA
jgi:ParB family chromosome partitioning protein